MKKKERKHMHIFFFKCHSEGELSPFRTHVLVKQQSRTLKRDCENVKQNNSKKKKNVPLPVAVNFTFPEQHRTRENIAYRYPQEKKKNSKQELE
jgi:hypothetical protein